ncbi:hypothetical protein HDU97_005235 [Phlyctochytrium planicorne]|nr:hypothetical protein HDU97_005235 [Phlyctochytrium planicorne]
MPLLDLPHEILPHIAEFLPFESLAEFSRASLIICRAIQASPAVAARSLFFANESVHDAIEFMIPKFRGRNASAYTRELEGNLISLLLKMGAISDEEMSDLVENAVNKKHTNAIHALVPTKGRLDLNASCILTSAAIAGDIEIIKLLFSLGVDPGHPNSPQALFYCLEDPEVLTFLIASGVSVKDAVMFDQRERMESALCRACEYGHVVAVHILLDAGADINYCGGRPLYYAIFWKKNDVVKALIERGVDVNLKYGGVSAVEEVLETCCKMNNSDAFFMLANTGADHKKSADRILGKAADSRMLAVIQWMIDHGTDITGDLGERVLAAAIAKLDINKFHQFYDAGARMTEEYLKNVLYNVSTEEDIADVEMFTKNLKEIIPF